MKNKKYPEINLEKCISCGTCISMCPVQALRFDKNNKLKLNQALCEGCGTCISVCPQKAIALK